MAYAASTIARDVKRRVAGLVNYPVADNVKLFKGCFIMKSAAGYATPADGATASLLYLGIADESVDNTEAGHAAGGKRVNVWQEGIFEVEMDGTVAADDLGAEVYLSTGASGNDYTVVNSADGDPGIAIKVGRITRVVTTGSGGVVEINIGGYAGQQSGSAN